jgi:hypothetical protein
MGRFFYRALSGLEILPDTGGFQDLTALKPLMILMAKSEKIIYQCGFACHLSHIPHQRIYLKRGLVHLFGERGWKRPEPLIRNRRLFRPSQVAYNPENKR